MIIIKNTKEDPKKKHVKDIKIFLKKKKIKDENRLEKSIKILLKNKKKKDVNTTWNLKGSYLTLEEIIF